MTDIERWLPQRWNEIIGNDELVEHYQDILRSFQDGDTAGINTMPIGDSRTGKTATTKLFVQAALCEQPDAATLNPCGKCRNCATRANQYGHRGLEVWLERGRVHYVPIDCTRITSSELRDTLTDLNDYEGIRIVFFDEVHRLHRQFMDEQLLKPVEEKSFMWIAGSATTEGLERMFLNRFVKIQTSLPTVTQLAKWLGDRCKQWRIDWDEPDTILLLAERSNAIPGSALQVLARANRRRDRSLTRELVERHIFDVSN